MTKSKPPDRCGHQYAARTDPNVDACDFCRKLEAGLLTVPAPGSENRER
jgi:hypothetical protein